jgi:Tol biopolymer transport system component
MQQGAGRPLQLSEDSTVDWSPTWSPDERYVAFAREVRGEHQIHIVPSIGGQGRSVVHLSDRRIQDVAWSPDTSRTVLVMAAQRQPHQAYALTAVEPDTDSTWSLTTPPLWSTGDSAPVFSPDGSQIAFVRGAVEGVEDIFVMSADGDDLTQVTSDSTTIHGLTWGQDGDRLVYSARRGGMAGLWTVSLDGGIPELVRPANEGTLFSQPTLSSTNLAYTQESAELDVWKLSRPNRRTPFEAEPLFTSTQLDTHPSISPSGERVAFVSERAGTPEVWMGQFNDSGLTQITSLDGPQIHSIAWSPDGTQLCFVVREKGQTDLFTVPASGGQATRLTQSETHELVPRWSRDGRWIYYSSNRTGKWEIWRRSVSSSSNEPDQVTVGGAVAAQESSTASTLYFVRPDTTGIWATPLDTTRLPLRTRPSGRVLTADSVLATRDTSAVLDTTGSDTTGSDTTATAPSTSVEHVVSQFDPQERHNWWVESDGIYFLRHRRLNAMVLTFYNFQTQDTVPLYTFANLRPGQHVAAGPNGNWFAYTHVARRQSDLMLVEDFSEE